MLNPVNLSSIKAIPQTSFAKPKEATPSNRQASLSGVPASYVIAFGVQVNGYEIEPGADLRNAQLNEANLREAQLQGANLTGAKLREANLSGANLSEANLSGVDLWGANLTCAQLNEANLFGADLWGVSLDEADLPGADLRSANLWDVRYSDTNLDGAKYNSETKFSMGAKDIDGAYLRDHPSIQEEFFPGLIYVEEDTDS